MLPPPGPVAFADHLRDSLNHKTDYELTKIQKNWKLNAWFNKQKTTHLQLFLKFMLWQLFLEQTLFLKEVIFEMLKLFSICFGVKAFFGSFQSCEKNPKKTRKQSSFQAFFLSKKYLATVILYGLISFNEIVPYVKEKGCYGVALISHRSLAVWWCHGLWVNCFQ